MKSLKFPFLFVVVNLTIPLQPLNCFVVLHVYTILMSKCKTLKDQTQKWKKKKSTI